MADDDEKNPPLSPGRDFGISGSSNVAVLNIDPESGVKRGLQTRHVSMMALAGIIGPGLLIGSGGALASGGPASLLICFLIIGVVAISVMQSVGELATLYPSGGAFISLGDRMVERAFGAALGWNYFIIWATVLANEYNVTTAVLSSWTGSVPTWGWFLILWVLFASFQMLGVSAYGEAEFWLALLKIVGLCAFFIFAIVYAAGGVVGRPAALGFHYWHDPGAFHNGFSGLATVFVFCSTFYAGTESVAVAATESVNPTIAVPKAVRQVVWRILVIYLGSALFFGMTCPANAIGLSHGSGALKSPMTIALQNAGWDSASNLINAFILVTCLSAINSSIYIGSRTILFMAQNGNLPKLLGRTNDRGVPVAAILLTNAFGALSMMNVNAGSAKAYDYIVNLSGVSTFLVWGSISFVHLRFRQAWKFQGKAEAELPYRSFLYPYNAYFGLFSNLFLALIQGWSSFAPFKKVAFVDAYILLVVFPLIYLGYKYFTKSKFQRVSDIDLHGGQRVF